MPILLVRAAIALVAFFLIVAVMGLLGALGPIELLVALVIALLIAWPLGGKLAERPSRTST